MQWKAEENLWVKQEIRDYVGLNFFFCCHSGGWGSKLHPYKYHPSTLPHVLSIGRLCRIAFNNRKEQDFLIVVKRVAHPPHF